VGVSGYSGYSSQSGVSGYSGYSSSSGYSGYSGSGVSGFSGFSGAGTSGFSGFSGAGLSGFSGFSSTAPGTSGFSGFSGAGTSGFSGFSGDATSGFSGYSAYSGYSGTAGSIGVDGASGFSGFSGLSGYSGYSGYSGAGLSGYSGYSAFSGYSAYSGYSGPQLLTFATVTDADHPLVLADANTGLKMSSAAAHSVNIPLNATQAFPTGTQIVVEQAGAGIVSITVTGGVTLQGASATNGQYSTVCLIKQDTDTWLATVSGVSGFSGFSGKSGYSGYSGYSGISGYSAFSGFSGAPLATCGVATSPTATQTDAITHGLGKTPVIIRLYGIGSFTNNASATPTTHCIGIYSSSGNRCVYQPYDPSAITGAEPGATSTAYAVRLDTGANAFITGVVQNVGATTFDIAWTETGTSAAQVYMWEAQ